MKGDVLTHNFKSFNPDPETAYPSALAEMTTWFIERGVKRATVPVYLDTYMEFVAGKGYYVHRFTATEME